MLSLRLSALSMVPVLSVREPPPAQHSAYNLDARPDCMVHNVTPTHHHKLFNQANVASPILTGLAPVPAAGSLSAFDNTEPRLLQTILGCPPDGAGWGKIVTLFVLVTLSRRSSWRQFGGMAGHACLLLRRLVALLRDVRFLPDPLPAMPSAASFAAYHAQSISLALRSVSSSTSDSCS
eukprot:3537366-Pleurochrysis_carterae.AAC.2